MANYLKMKQRQQVIALLELGWTYRRIEAETGVRRETVSRYDRRRRSNAAKVFPGSAPPAGAPGAAGAPEVGPEASNPAKVFPGSAANAAKVFAGSPLPPRSVAAPYHDAIGEKLDAGLSLQRIWQDLVEEYGYGGSYESVKRYARRLERPRRTVGVYHSAPGEEGQIDFFRGAPTLRPETGQWARPWVFRMTLCHSRHGYEEAVWDQTLETWLRLHENAFADFGGVPEIVRHDNLKAAVVRACLYDPDSNDIYAAFARHWGFTPLPIRPWTPQENGKQERSGGYVKDNALKGRRFESLAEQNAFLKRWNRTVARLRIHGTTRRQVWTHFLATDQPALRPVASEPFPLFASGIRTLHPDRHIEVQGAFYPIPLQLPIGEQIRARWDQHLVRVYHAEALPGRLQQAVGASLPHQEFLELLVEDELVRRADRLFARRLKQAGIMAVKEFADFDWAYNPKLPRARLCELAAGRFVAQHLGVLLIGPPGIGKSHAAVAIAVGAIRAGYRALIRSSFDLAQDFAEAEATGERRAFVEQLTRVDLLVLEDFGMRKLGPPAAEDLLEILVRRHERASTLITTNRPTQDWGVFLGDVPATTAILDRFLEHAEIVPMNGKSYRLRRRTIEHAPAGKHAGDEAEA